MAEDAEGDSLADDVSNAEEQQLTGAGEQAPGRPELRLAVVIGAVVAVAVAGVAGWVSYGAWRCHDIEQQRALFLHAAEQSAHDLTTISHTNVEADVQRILAWSTGPFYDDFSQRKQPFIDHIKQVRSTSTGTVTGAGLESAGDNSARALVAVAVKLSKGGDAEQKLDGFRLRLDLQRVGAGAKVSNVEYVQ
jgi:Mce-associated membrane protein